MWGRAIEFWDTASVVLMWTAGIATAIAAVTGFGGSLISREVSVRMQRDSEEKIATANSTAANATLKLEQLRQQVGHRQLLRQVFLDALDGQPSSPVSIMYLRDDPECFDLAQQIWRVLQDAHWAVTPPAAINEEAGRASNDPLAMSVDVPSGITIVARSISQNEVDADFARFHGREWEKTPYTVLTNAFIQSIGKVAGHAGGPNSPPVGTLRVVVAPR